MKGTDFAQYTVIPERWQWERIDAAGFGEFTIIAVGDLNRLKRNHQIESALRVGKRPEGYIYLHMGTAEAQMTEAIQNLEREGYDCPFLWPDIEETRGYSPAQVVRSLQECVAIGVTAGYDRATKQGIYTGGWFWPQATGNSQAFADMALWTAFYNTDGAGVFHDDWPIDFARFSPYGGWANLPRSNRRDTRQYRGTYDLAGVNVDLNWRDDKWKQGGEDLATIGDLARIIEAATPDEREHFNALLMQGKIPIYPLAPQDHPTLAHVLHLAYYDESDEAAGGNFSRGDIEQIVEETIESARLEVPDGDE